MISGGWFNVTDLRFRFAVGVSGGCALLCEFEVAVVSDAAGCKLGGSAVGGY